MGDVPAATALHPGQGRQRTLRRHAAGGARWLHRAERELSQLCQWPELGADGWLYGRCGASCPGDVGLPGTPAAQRVPMRGTMWRYHPQRKVFEALCSGTHEPVGA
ncbi:MAG: hypothetical protein WDN28_21480 [Chthoniobacter sp.]